MNNTDNEKVPNITREHEDKILLPDEKKSGEIDGFEIKFHRKSEGTIKMKNFEKFAEKRKQLKENRDKRTESIYKMEEDYSAYGRFCAKNTCVGVWKELLGYEAKKKLGIERVSEVWKCPNCDQVTQAHGSTAEQNGFSAYNTQNVNQDVTPPVIEEDKDRTKR